MSFIFDYARFIGLTLLFPQKTKRIIFFNFDQVMFLFAVCHLHNRVGAPCMILSLKGSQEDETNNCTIPSLLNVKIESGSTSKGDYSVSMLPHSQLIPLQFDRLSMFEQTNNLWTERGRYFKGTFTAIFR